MESFVIKGGKPLNGEVAVECSKNSLLPIIAASIMCSQSVRLLDVPMFSDIINMLNIAKSLGAVVTINNSEVTIDATNISNTNLPKELAGSLRASILFLGALISKLGNASTFMPGGCKIGARPIDLHLFGFSKIGVDYSFDQDHLICQTKAVIGGIVKLKMPSVGATENIIMCAALARGKETKIIGAAAEPEILDLCNFINSMGGKISGAGTSTITIVGVEKLYGTTYRAISDRIVAGTYLIASAMCGGQVILKNVDAQHNKILISILLNLGCQIKLNGDNICVQSPKTLHTSGVVTRLGGIHLQTEAYPGFATDLQSQTMAMLATVSGTHSITETLFENRFNHASGLVSLGASIATKGNVATIVGASCCYHGGIVSSADLRGGAALVLAGLASQCGQTTVVQNIHYIDRGYYNLEQKLCSLGADICRKNV